MAKNLQQLLLFGIALFGGLIAGIAQPATDIFISEYVEGTSNNKALELYNGTGSPIDLSAGNYVIQMYFNGSANVGTTIPLTGTIAANGTYILAHGSASFIVANGGSVVPHLTNSASWYNGDDAILLRKGGPAGTIVDAIGQVGFDPGTEWGTGLVSTADNTLRRKATICQGDAVASNVFEPAIEWEGFATDVFNGLGSHISQCSGPDTVAIPDANFKQALIQRGVDANGNGKIEKTEALAIDSLNIQGVDAIDLAGLEEFKNLVYLNCSNVGRNPNPNASQSLLNVLNLSGNTKLETLISRRNMLWSMDLSALTNLKYFDHTGNEGMQALDLSYNKKLKVAIVRETYNLNSLKLPEADSLVKLDLSYNNLENINLSLLPNLRDVSLEGSYSLQSLNFSNNKQLRKLDISRMDALTNVVLPDADSLYSLTTAFDFLLQGLDVSQLQGLIELNVTYNGFSHLDISKNPKLSMLDTRGNSDQNSPFILSICVSDLSAASSNPNFFKDPRTVYTNNCWGSTPVDLIISEYIEGTSNNKALEIYNPTENAINLNSGNYLIQMYFNGSTTVGATIPLTGTIAAKSTYVLAHGAASFITTNGGSVVPNLTNSGSWYNGDDAIVLRKGGTTGAIIDAIGQVGFDPGTEWGTGLTSTADNTLRRRPAICTGDANPTDTYIPLSEWEGYVTDEFNGLGIHTSSCSSTTPIASLTTSPTNLNFTTTVAVASDVKYYTLNGNNLTEDVTITAPANFSISTSRTGVFGSNLIIPFAEVNAGDSVFVQFASSSNQTQSGVIAHSSGSLSVSVAVTGTATSGLTPIYAIQGTANESGYKGQIVTTSGIVVADFQGANQLNGFYLQDFIGDGNPATSDGIFVFNTSYSVNVGDFVTLTGEVDEYFNSTQLKNVTSLGIYSSNNTLPVPTDISLPVASVSELERYEGMLVRFPQTLTATEVYTLGRFGEVSLSVNGRLFNPTNFIDPNDDPATGTSSTGMSNVAAVNAQQDLNNRSRILLDDASSVQNPAVVPFLNPADTTLRVGSTVANVTGVLDYAFSKYRIQPTEAPSFNYAPRPTVPHVGNANVKVASFNVLNYFNGNGMGGGFPTPRGANTLVEFNRQRTKIIHAIKSMDADVIGLMEMENDGDGAYSAIADLVNGLNAATASGTYAYVLDPSGPNGTTGTDAIKVALIYKPGVVTPFGPSKADMNSVHNRPPLAQTFTLNSNGERFSVVVNHFKSKGCDGATGANADQLDGQGCFNASRKSQASALLAFIGALKSIDEDVITVGDYNAYGQEDPMDVLAAGGLINLLPNTYSYVFDGQSGSLDHALVTPSLNMSVTGAAKWHINSDEPIFKDYNQEFNPAYAYSSGPYRSSDHDPILVGLRLRTEQATPVLVSFSKTTQEDVVLNFSKEEFTSSFTDSDGDSLTQVKLVSLPKKGVLTIGTLPVQVGQVLTPSQLSQLRYVPNLDINGVDTIQWNAMDGSQYALVNAQITITILPVNDAPFTVVTSPATGTNFVVGSTIVIKASASDVDGTIKKVLFYANQTFLGEDSKAPYEFEWTGAEPSLYYNIYTKAIDNQNATSVSATVSIVVSSCAGNGSITREMFHTLPGSHVSDLTSSPQYPNYPTYTTTRPSFEGTPNAGDNFGSRMIGYICAPETGDYTFWIAADDRAELWLSTDASPMNKQLIASVPQAVNPRAYLKYPSQKSLPIRLAKGARYFVMALHKEATSNDHISVAWTLPSGTYENPIPGSRLSPWSSGTVYREGELEKGTARDGFAEMKVSPIPATDIVTAEFYSEAGGEGEISLKDALSNEVLKNTFEARKGANSASISVQGLPTGLYFVNIMIGTERFVKKIVVSGE